MIEANLPDFLVIYYTPSGAMHSSRVIRAADYWEACGVAWDQVPPGADDFQIAG